MAFKWSDFLPGTWSKSFSLEEIRKSKFGEYFDHLQQTLDKYSADNSLLESITGILSVEFSSDDLNNVNDSILKKVPDFGFETRRLVLHCLSTQDDKVYSACVSANHNDYDYLNSQMISLLDYNPRIFINDTSRIHTLKFQPDKKVPKTVLGYSLDIQEGWKGILWFADANEVSLTKDQADGLAMVKDAVSHRVNQAIDNARISNQSELFKLAFDHLPYPSFILIGKTISHINQLAGDLFKARGIDVDKMKVSIQTAIEEEKTHVIIADHHYQMYTREMETRMKNNAVLVILVNDQQTMMQRQYLDSAARAIAHNIETPLKNILGYTQAIPLLSELNDSQQNYLNRIAQESDKCLSFSEGLLDLARFAGDQPMLVEEVTVKEVVDQLLEASRHLFRQKRVIINYESEGLYQTAIVDKHLFSQAVYLLIEYILERLDPGKKIDSSFFCENEAYSLRLSDNGKGISEIDLALLNQEIPDSSVDSRIRTVCGIMRLHGGRLIIKSELGKGSEYFLTWPVVKKNPNLAK